MCNMRQWFVAASFACFMPIATSLGIIKNLYGDRKTVAGLETINIYGDILFATKPSSMSVAGTALNFTVYDSPPDGSMNLLGFRGAVLLNDLTTEEALDLGKGRSGYAFKLNLPNKIFTPILKLDVEAIIPCISKDEDMCVWKASSLLTRQKQFDTYRKDFVLVPQGTVPKIPVPQSVMQQSVMTQIPTQIQVPQIPTQVPFPQIQVPQIPTQIQVPQIPTQIQVPQIPTQIQVPQVPTQIQVPQIPTQIQVPQIPTQIQVPQIPTQIQVPQIPTHIQVPQIPTQIQVPQSFFQTSVPSRF